jgi:hypothetical protein
MFTDVRPIAYGAGDQRSAVAVTAVAAAIVAMMWGLPPDEPLTSIHI